MANLCHHPIWYAVIIEIATFGILKDNEMLAWCAPIHIRFSIFLKQVSLVDKMCKSRQKYSFTIRVCKWRRSWDTFLHKNIPSLIILMILIDKGKKTPKSSTVADTRKGIVRWSFLKYKKKENPLKFYLVCLEVHSRNEKI